MARTMSRQAWALLQAGRYGDAGAAADRALQALEEEYERTGNPLLAEHIAWTRSNLRSVLGDESST